MNSYIINDIFKYCLNNNNDRFRLEDVYNYFNWNFDKNEISRNLLFLQNIGTLFFYRRSTGEFQLEIKKIHPCKYYNSINIRCINRSCFKIHICSDILHYSMCKKGYKCPLKHSLTRENQPKIEHVNMNKIDLDLFLSILQFYYQNRNAFKLFHERIISTRKEFINLYDIFGDDRSDYVYYKTQYEYFDNFFKITNENRIDVIFKLEICDNYIKRLCNNRDCVYFHICPNEMFSDRCTTNKCTNEHSLDSEHNIGLLQKKGFFTVNRSFLFHIIKFLHARDISKNENIDKIEKDSNIIIKIENFSQKFENYQGKLGSYIERLEFENDRLKLDQKLILSDYEVTIESLIQKFERLKKEEIIEKKRHDEICEETKTNLSKIEELESKIFTFRSGSNNDDVKLKKIETIREYLYLEMEKNQNKRLKECLQTIYKNFDVQRLSSINEFKEKILNEISNLANSE